MPGGKDMIIVYQMLMLESLATDSVIYYEGMLPTLEKELAVRLDVKEEDIQMTLAYFKNVGLAQVDDSNNAEMLQVPALIEQETDWARYKREQRKALKLDNVQRVSNDCPTELELDIEKDIDIEREIEKEQEKDVRSTYKMFEDEYGRLLSSSQSETVLKLLEENSADLVQEALKRSVLNGKTKRGTLNLAYIEGILRNWQLDNVQSVSGIRKPKPNYSTSHYKQYNIPDWTNEEVKNEQTAEGQAKLAELFAELEAMEDIDD